MSTSTALKKTDLNGNTDKIFFGGTSLQKNLKYMDFRMSSNVWISSIRDDKLKKVK